MHLHSREGVQRSIVTCVPKNKSKREKNMPTTRRFGKVHVRPCVVFEKKNMPTKKGKEICTKINVKICEQKKFF